jgi:hypothetical protein
MPCVLTGVAGSPAGRERSSEELENEGGRKVPNSPSKKKESGTLSRSLYFIPAKR